MRPPTVSLPGGVLPLPRNPRGKRAVSFFDTPPPKQPPRADPQRQPWRGTADDTLGVPVPFAEVLARSDEVAILVSGLVAYPSGFSLTVIMLSRLKPPGGPFSPAMHGHLGVAPDQGGEFRFGIGFSDGSKLIVDRGPWRPVEPGVRTIRGQGGGGGDGRWTQGYFCQPLPPAGELRFVCVWPAFDIPETSLPMDAQLIIGAAEKATPIWPDDVGLPEPPGGRPTGPHFGSVSGSVSSSLSTRAVPPEQPAE